MSKRTSAMKRASEKNERELKEKSVCIDLNALFHSKRKNILRDFFSEYVWCRYCLIRKDGDYYELHSDMKSNLRLCCDGEQCLITERLKRGENDCVNLISADNIDNEDLDGIDTVFTLTEEEFMIATGEGQAK